MVGVVSWGNPSCLGTTVFARVTNVLPWIQEQMRQAAECGNIEIIICIDKKYNCIITPNKIYDVIQYFIQ